MIGKIYKRQGAVSIVILAITMLFLVMFILLIAILITYINTYVIVYNYKIDLYNLNRSAIISVNKLEGKYGIYNYDANVYLNKFKELLILTYNLDGDLKNGSRYIQEVDIIEYEIKNNEIYVYTSIKYIPIIFRLFFSNGCTFYVKNNISIKTYI